MFSPPPKPRFSELILKALADYEARAREAAVALTTAEAVRLRKACLEDWRVLCAYRWPFPAAADEAGAKREIRRIIAWQRTHDLYLICEKESGLPVGFAGLERIKPHVHRVSCLVIAPAHRLRGYGGQAMRLLENISAAQDGRELFYAAADANHAGCALAAFCGFALHHTEDIRNPGDKPPCAIRIYCKKLQPPVSRSMLPPV